MDKNCPKVSVIIPLYKVEEYLPECLDSVVRQTLKDIEVICVNDGSPDRSADIAAEYAQKYEYIKVVHKENGGLSSARNFGLDRAQGKYVYFLDSDDFLEPETLEELCEIADADELDIVYFNTHLYFENQEVKDKNRNYIDYYTRKGNYDGVHTGQTMFSMMRRNREFFPSACLQMFRRDMLEENSLRFYNGIIHEDNLFSFQCMIIARRVGYARKAYYHRRMHDDSIMTANKSMRNVEGYLVAYAEILAFMHGRQVEESAFNEISEFLYTSIWGNGRRIYNQLEITPDKAVMTKGDFCAAHFLDMIKRSGETEFERSRLKAENARLRKVTSSWSYRVGRAITFIPRKVVGGCRCIRQHGLKYTIKLGIKKIWGRCKSLDRKLYSNKVYQKLIYIPRQCVHFLKYIRKNGVASLVRAISVKQHMKFGGSEPLLSIIMPVYNVERFIGEGLDSLLNQTMKHIEIICVDDGSTDRSLEILNQYAAKDKRVRVLNQKNKGAGAARNLGISAARGEYMIFLDSDDFFSEDLAKEVYYAAKLHEADVVLFAAKHYNNATGEFREAKWLLNSYVAPRRQPFNYKDCPNNLYRITTPCPWTKAFRRQFVLDSGLQFQEIQNTNDLFFVFTALTMAERVVTLDKQLVFYRVGLENNLQTTKKKHPFCVYEALGAWHDKLAELGVLDTVRKSYVNAALSTCLFGLRTQKDISVKESIFNKLQSEVIEALELSGHEESYYDTKANYHDMLQVLNGSFEEYMKNQV